MPECDDKETKSCELCKYWERNADKGDNPNEGECRRFPPAVTGISWSPHLTYERTVVTEHPETCEGDWCWEFCQKEKPLEWYEREDGERHV